ncbi:tetratricopeptide repeat protein [Ursidibacter arcticus]
MKLSHIFRTTILATTLAFGLTGYTQASDAEIIQQFQQGVKAAEQKDYATALKFWQPLAEQGNAATQYNLGVMYEKGWGVAQDYQQAVYWYQKAAQQGDVESQSSLGSIYLRQNDKQQAVYWYQKAAQQGDVESQFNLGFMYKMGLDDQQALYWWQKAAQQGNAKAQHYLGDMYYGGNGVKKDIKKARSLWQQACKQGYRIACEALEETKPSKKAK